KKCYLIGACLKRGPLYPAELRAVTGNDGVSPLVCAV
ncbi:MAG: hypothetical protein ACI9WS_002843, partial [Paraglaciecola psychrophila]